MKDRIEAHLFYRDEHGYWCATDDEDILWYAKLKYPPQWWRREKEALETNEVVKVYVYKTDQPFSYVEHVEFGYMERRLSALDRLKIRLIAMRLWDIPF